MNNPYTLTIYGPKGFLKEPLSKDVRVLDVGCGERKLPGATGIDVLSGPSVDIVHDLSIFPWPIKDGSYDLVFANHFLEHAEDVIGTLREMHRVLAPSGRVVVQVPYFRATDAYGDPTHRHFFTSRSLDYVIEGTRAFTRYGYAPFSFKKIGFWYAWPQPSKNPLAGIFKRFIHARPELYDQYLSIFFPVECVTWELEKPA